MSNEDNNKPPGDTTSKELTLTPALTALLKPAADYLGNELKSRISDKIDELRERRRQANLLEHLTNVTAKTGLHAEVVAGDRQLSLFREWVEGAQEIPPEDRTLSSMWEALLVKILKGVDVEGKLVRALSSLSESDAALLLKFSRSSKYRPKDRRERYQIQQPQFRELVEPSHLLQWLNNGTTGIGFLYLMGLLYFESRDLKDLSDASFAAAYGLLYRLLPKIALIVGFGSMLALLYWRFVPSLQLTWFGSELLKHASVSERDIQIIEHQA